MKISEAEKMEQLMKLIENFESEIIELYKN